LKLILEETENLDSHKQNDARGAGNISTKSQKDFPLCPRVPVCVQTHSTSNSRKKFAK
jgi:hypothetical protein